MRPWAKSLWSGIQFVADIIVLIACWALWIGLGALLAMQIRVAVTRELAVPNFVLRSLEERFTASHVNPRFGRATFDATGGILLENVALSLPEFTEPVAKARAVYLELDPWLLLGGKLAAKRVHATGITLSVPAMLTPSGRSEETVSDLDFTVAARAGQLEVEHLTAQIAGTLLELHGGFHLPPRSSDAPIAPLPLIANLAQHYVSFCRQLLRLGTELSIFNRLALHGTLTPSATRGALAAIELSAAHVNSPQLGGLEAHEIRVAIRVPLLGNAPTESPVTLIADEIKGPQGIVAHRVQANVSGQLSPTQFRYMPASVELTADAITARGFRLNALSAAFVTPSASVWNGVIDALSLESPVSLAAHANLGDKTAEVQIKGGLAPGLLDPIGANIGHDVRRFIGFGEPLLVDLVARFDAGWKFAGLNGQIVARKVDAYSVPIDFATGQIEFDGRHFLAHHATARLGENEARGSFAQDLSTLEFRFLLEGHLRPLEIGGWFGGWWPDFFQHFQFPSAPPNASVDVAGRWLAGYQTTVFVFAESNSPIIRDTTLDYGRTIMFIRPNFFDALEFFATRGAGDVRGSFTRQIDLDQHDWSSMMFSIDSTLDLPTGVGLLGTEIRDRLEPFTFATPPHVKASGRLDGPAAPGGEHQKMDIIADSTGPFTLYKFPARNLSFEARLQDDVLFVQHAEVEVASGKLSGSARLSGPDQNRRLGFNAALRDARLSEAVTTLSNYAAERRGQPAAAEGDILPGKSQVKFDVNLSAEGRFDDLYSYQGNGNAALSGAELGEVRLLGLLSALLDFTALRFTNARMNFNIEGKKVTFPSVSVTGANSAVEGHGEFYLDRGEIDFKARVYPFSESKSLFQSVVGVVLTPLSTALEVKLTGPLAQPSWAFVIGPTNFFRSLTQSEKPTEVVPAATTSSAPTTVVPTPETH